jgi:hypothetical protein
LYQAYLIPKKKALTRAKLYFLIRNSFWNKLFITPIAFCQEENSGLLFIALLQQNQSDLTLDTRRFKTGEVNAGGITLGLPDKTMLPCR